MSDLNWPADSRLEPLTVASNSFALAAGVQQLVAEGSEGFDSDDALVDWQSRLDAALETTGDKLEMCAAVIRRADAEADFADAEATRWAAASKRAKAKKTNVTARIKALLEAQRTATGNGMAIVGPSWVKLANQVSKAVDCPDPLKLPFEFQRIKVEADKSAIADAIKTGKTVTGASIQTTVTEVVKFGK